MRTFSELTKKQKLQIVDKSDTLSISVLLFGRNRQRDRERETQKEKQAETHRQKWRERYIKRHQSIGRDIEEQRGTENEDWGDRENREREKEDA